MLTSHIETTSSRLETTFGCTKNALLKLKKAMLFLSFSFLFLGEISAQSIISYDFKTGAFSAPIPYDELITFELTNINGIPDSIVFIAYEKQNLGDNTHGRNVLKKVIQREEVRADSSAMFVSTTYFKPNRDYIFSITAYLKSRELYNNEKTKLKNAFVSDALIGSIMADLHNKAVEAAKDTSPGLQFEKNVQIFLDKRILDIAQNTLGPNVSFVSTQDSRSKFLGDVGTYGNKLMDVIRQIEDVIKSLNATSPTESALRNELAVTKANIEGFTEWPKTADNQAAIRADILRIKEKYDPLDSAYLNAIRNKWDTFIRAADTLESTLKEYKVLAAIVSDLQLANVANPSYPKALKEQASGYFAIDFGMAYIPNIDKFMTFTSASFYFRPIKRNVPLRMYVGWDQLWARLSVDLGFTLNSIAEDGVRRGFSFDQSAEATNALMVGLSVRVLSFAKVNMGTMIYQSKELTQPETNYSYAGSFYFGVSIDLSLKGLVTENFGPKKVTSVE